MKMRSELSMNVWLALGPSRGVLKEREFCLRGRDSQVEPGELRREEGDLLQQSSR
jgi:hypothetical protein